MRLVESSPKRHEIHSSPFQNLHRNFIETYRKITGSDHKKDKSRLESNLSISRLKSIRDCQKLSRKVGTIRKWLETTTERDARDPDSILSVPNVIFCSFWTLLTILWSLRSIFTCGHFLVTSCPFLVSSCYVWLLLLMSLTLLVIY